MAESQLAVEVRPPENETIGFCPHCGVAVRRGKEYRHPVAGPDVRVAELCVFNAFAMQALDWSVAADTLVDERAHERAVGTELSEEMRFLHEYIDEIAEQIAGGFRARDDKRDSKAYNFLPG